MQWVFLVPGLDFPKANEGVSFLGLPNTQQYLCKQKLVLDLTKADVNALCVSDTLALLHYYEQQTAKPLIVVCKGAPECLTSLEDRADCVSLENIDSTDEQALAFERIAETLQRELVFLEPTDDWTIESLVLFSEE